MMKIPIILLICFFCVSGFGQKQRMQFFKPNDLRGLHIFETGKEDTASFDGLTVRIGGNFSQDFQALDHENTALPVFDEDSVNVNALVPLSPGFNLAMANLLVDAQLADGIRLNLTMYLSSRHHEEAWVKGGYIQFDKLGFLNSPLIDRLMERLTLKIGDYELDYGDQHFRRSDGGNTFFNPFAENYIMDAFSTEIGGELYYHAENGFLAMAGITNGQLNPTVRTSTRIDSVTGELNRHAPAFHGKIGLDRRISEDLRFRMTGSFYTISSAPNNPLFFGDRTGSHYFFVLENTLASAGDDAWSGRFNPRFSDQVSTFMINPFITWRGLEIFGTFETAKGRLIDETEKRNVTQTALDVLYRFPRNTNRFWIGGRYNTVTAELPDATEEVTIDRYVASAGWFINQHILLKLEYVSQSYMNFEETDLRAGGKFDGLFVQAAVAF